MKNIYFIVILFWVHQPSIGQQKDNIWIGTNGGIYRYHPKTGELLHFDKILPPNDRRNLSLNGYITAIEEDKQGKLWLGCSSGITVHDPKQKTLAILNHGNSKLPLDRVLSIHCSKTGQIGVGVFGVNYFNAF